MNADELAKAIGHGELTEMPRDVSPRRYYRSEHKGEEFVVMHYPDIDEKSIQEMRRFIEIGQWLDHAGIKVASCFRAEPEKGYAILEDLGKQTFGNYLRHNPKQIDKVYIAATSALIKIAAHKAPYNLTDYKENRIYENRRQFVDYYMQYTQTNEMDETIVQEFLSVLNKIEESLSPCPQGFVHGDYHLENIMRHEDDSGYLGCALIDYQDAFFGPLPYDLLNLLEDARNDVPKDIKTRMQNLYCADMTQEEKTSFMNWYKLLSMHFHCRVIGLFIKLSAEQGRDSYLVHIPRLQKYISENLKDPLFEPLKTWFDEQGVDFAPQNDLDGEHIRNVFSHI